MAERIGYPVVVYLENYTNVSRARAIVGDPFNQKTRPEMWSQTGRWYMWRVHSSKYLAPKSIDNTDVFNVDDCVSRTRGANVNGG